jgi:hypothetical protein
MINKGLTVGNVTAVQLSTTELHGGVCLVADRTNTGTVYWACRSDVTAKGGDSTTGTPLYPGATAEIPIDKASSIYLIADASSQYVFYAGQ